ncbi:hypothetical protein B0F90DRAFT_1729112 [Multifurca ochricompacta]|uniref:Uncharacterized protein n=1 Tax=Multifurca ochricompacta TaxID=376703 RepID=A0AAD4M4C0_9AGAM|nr:hypothetical protein B0F90DRAFT_1729112 [Multifurca ochricompacta]
MGKGPVVIQFKKGNFVNSSSSKPKKQLDPPTTTTTSCCVFYEGEKNEQRDYSNISIAPSFSPPATQTRLSNPKMICVCGVDWSPPGPLE